MRRIAFLAIAVSLAGCDAPGPLDPPAATPTRGAEAYDGGIMIGSGTAGITASAQNDTTSLSESADSPPDGASGGILIGSGT